MKDKVQKIVGNLDRGFYKEARSLPGGPRTSFGYLADMMAQEGVYPEAREVEERVQRMLEAGRG